MDIKGICISTTEDEHGPIYVYETRTSRILSFDGKIYQSSMKLNDVNGLTLGYTQAMMVGLFFVPEINTATIMGLGAGSMTKKLLSSFSEINVHAVEYRRLVVEAAKEYFFLPDSERLIIHIDDAVNYLRGAKQKSDIIFSDLYNSNGMESKQVQASYLNNCKEALNDKGVLVLNIWHTLPALKKELDNLLALVFENRVLSFEVESGNTIVLAFKSGIPLINKSELLSKGEWLQEKMKIPLERYARLLGDKENF